MKTELDFFKGKTVLVTGHTGFKGTWMSKMLVMLGANVIGYAEMLQETLGTHVCVAYLHGKLRPKEKNAIMERFASGEIC